MTSLLAGPEIERNHRDLVHLRHGKAVFGEASIASLDAHVVYLLGYKRKCSA
jgi:hypothetical protein